MLFWCICACYCHDKLEKCLKYFLKGVLQDSNSTQLKKQLMHNIPSGNKLPVIKAIAKLRMAPNWMKKRERNKRRPWLLLRGWGFYNRYKRGHSQRQRPLEESRLNTSGKLNHAMWGDLEKREPEARLQESGSGDQETKRQRTPCRQNDWVIWESEQLG